jgi:hypothetical protein
MIAADELVLAKIDAHTRVIPGHGPLGDKASLQAFHDMLVKVRDNVKKGVAAKKTRDEVLASKPTGELDGTWGKGFLKPEDFAGMVYTDLTRGKK